MFKILFFPGLFGIYGKIYNNIDCGSLETLKLTEQEALIWESTQTESICNLLGPR